MRSEPSAPARKSQATPPPPKQVVPAEERFRILVDSVEDYAIFMLDPDGCIMSWNVGAQKIKGYTAQEVIGRHISIFYLPEDIASGKPAHMLKTAATVGRVEEEGWRVRKDGSLFWANAVVTALYTAHGGERKLRGYAKVTRDMTEHKRLRDLEAASGHMNEFLATLAHELRNPLAPVSNALSVMMLEPLVSPTLKQCRDIIDRQISHLTRLVEDLLDAGRITTGKIALRLAPVDLRDVAVDAIEMMHPLLGFRQQVVQVEAPEAGVFVNGDTARLVQVIQNLLNNASKFSEPGDPISVTIAEESRTFAVVRVADRGSGIEPQAIGSIFDLFVQADTRLERKESGLGIGLTICRWLVEMHGGSIAAASDGLGCGAAFTVRLPLLGAQDAANDGASAGRTGRTGLREAESEGLSILIVDDNCDSADSMAMLLRLKGHRVDVAYGGAQALAFAARTPVVHVALIDIAMPGADGFSVLHDLKQAKGFERTLFAAMTGFGQDSDIERSLSQGFDMHLTKPVQLPLIEALLRRADERRRANS